MTIILQRNNNGVGCTLGQLFINGKQAAVTLEPHTPAIPAGEYACIPHSGPEWQNVWEITNVPGHTAILIHAGNFPKDTHGCVLVGRSYGLGYMSIEHSRNTLYALRDTLPDNFTLTVKDADNAS